MFATNNIAKANFDKLSSFEYNLKNMMQMLKEIKEDMRQYSFHMKMDCTDLSDFFPLKTDDDLKKFFDKDHEDWNLRKRGFHHLLYTTVTNQKKKFGTALLHTLFTREFIANHRWPFPGYVTPYIFL